jgi:hypothetical protein
VIDMARMCAHAGLHCFCLIHVYYFVMVKRIG